MRAIPQPVSLRSHFDHRRFAILLSVQDTEQLSELLAAVMEHYGLPALSCLNHCFCRILWNNEISLRLIKCERFLNRECRPVDLVWSSPPVASCVSLVDYI